MFSSSLPLLLPLLLVACTFPSVHAQPVAELCRTHHFVEKARNEMYKHCAEKFDDNLPDYIAPNGPAQVATASFKAHKIKMFVYKPAKNVTGEQRDFVSLNLKESGQWEHAMLGAMAWAMEQPLPPSAGNHSTDMKSHSPLFVDIGGNVGTHTFGMAAQGYNTMTFEAMDSNRELIMSTLCINPQLRSNIVLHAYGLGEKPTTCMMYANRGNFGDGYSLCGKSMDDLQASIPSFDKQYFVRGQMDMEMLDSFLCTDVKVLKIDVEGFEPWVFAGAKRLFTEHKIWFIAMEFSNLFAARIKRNFTSEVPAHPIQLTEWYGYKCRPDSFQGPAMTKEQIETAVNHPTNEYNLFCVHPEMYEFMQQQGKT
eukprot:gene25960-11644_t